MQSEQNWPLAPFDNTGERSGLRIYFNGDFYRRQGSNSGFSEIEKALQEWFVQASIVLRVQCVKVKIWKIFTTERNLAHNSEFIIKSVK